MNLCKQCGCEFVKKHGRQMYCEQHQPRKFWKPTPFTERRTARVSEWVKALAKKGENG